MAMVFPHFDFRFWRDILSDATMILPVVHVQAAAVTYINPPRILAITVPWRPGGSELGSPLSTDRVRGISVAY